jgi:hypothetical protein
LGTKAGGPNSGGGAGTGGTGGPNGKGSNGANGVNGVNGVNDQFKVDFSKIQQIIGRLQGFQQELDKLMMDHQVSSYIGMPNQGGSANATPPKTLNGGRIDAFVPAHDMQAYFGALAGAVNGRLSWLKSFIEKTQTDVTLASSDAKATEEKNSYNAADLNKLFSDLNPTSKGPMSNVGPIGANIITTPSFTSTGPNATGASTNASATDTKK